MISLGRMALWLGLMATASLALGGRTEGFNRDEAQYFDAGELYSQWYGELGEAIASGRFQRVRAQVSPEAIDRRFSFNHEHPALMKTLYGFSWRLFHRTLGWLSDAQAMRLPADLAGGLLVALVYLFGAQACSRRAGLVAALLTLGAPRLFFHAQLACFDAPIVTAWLGTIYCYWRSLTDRRWGFWTGVAFGLALATKHNAFFLPILIGGHWIIIAIVAGRRVEALPSARPLVWMALLGPAIEYAHWPWLWYHPIERFREYLNFHLHHVHYNFEYFGKNLNQPPYPFSEPFVLTGLTLPVTTLLLGLGGFGLLFWRWWRKQSAGRTPALLLAVNALFPPSIIAFSGAPIFGETKHWLATVPFLAIAAGIGLDLLSHRCIEVLSLRGRSAQAALALLVVMAVAPALAETWRAHPYALTHYNLLAGGPAGGADLGMNRQFWGYSARGVFPWINAHAPRHAGIYWHDASPTLNISVREGLLRADLHDTGLEEPGVRQADLGLVIHELHFNKYEHWMWDFYGTTQPSYVLADEGVPLVTVYERRK